MKRLVAVVAVLTAHLLGTATGADVGRTPRLQSEKLSLMADEKLERAMAAYTFIVILEQKVAATEAPRASRV